jgi:uncharacterized protein (TIGR02246 family)
MKPLFIVVAALIIEMVAAGQQPLGTKARHVSDLQAIEELEQTDAMAAKTNDVERLTSLWTDDAVLLQPMSPPVIGRSNIRALLQAQKQHSANVVVLSYTEDWKERNINGGRAFEWGTITATMQFPNGKQATQTVYAARVLVRDEGSSWRFARAIISPAPPPAEMNGVGPKP